METHTLEIRNTFTSILETQQLPDFDGCRVIFTGLLSDLITSIGYVNADETLSDEQKKLLQVNWVTEARDYAVLLRDICFRLYRDDQLLKDGRTDQTTVDEYNRETIEVLHSATESIINNYDRYKQTPSEKSWDEIKHYYSPSAEVEKQIKRCIDQLETMDKAQETLFDVSKDIQRVKGQTFEECNKLVQFLKDQRNYAEEALEFLSNKIAAEDPEEVIKLGVLNKIVQKIDFEKLETNYSHLLLPRKGISAIPFQVKEGELYVKELDFANDINSWLEDRILPVLRNRSMVCTQVRNNFEAKLFNGYNRLQLLQEDIGDYKKQLESLYLTIKTEQDAISLALVETESELAKMKDELRTTLDPAAIYSEERVFLPQYQSLVKETMQDRSNRFLGWLNFEKIRENWLRSTNRLWSNNNGYGGDKEELISYISDKDISQLDRYDQALFFNKGYLGKTFTVEREDFTKKFNQAFEDWKKGFAGSILIHGERLSGKTTLLESILLRTKEKCVLLRPGEEWSLLGRKQPGTTDLGNILPEITEQSIGKSMIVLIDDLEMWRDSSVYLLHNVEKLITVMNRYQRNLFFVIVTNSFLKNKLDAQLSFSDHFAYHFITNQMYIENVVEAITIRQNALIRNSDKSDKGLSENKTEKVARKIARKNHGNIGMSLIEWANYHDTKFSYSERRKIFKQFEDLVREHNQMLTYLLQFKSTTEQELSKLVPGVLMEKYRNSIRILLTYKIIERAPNGRLGLNEVIAHDIEDILTNRKHILN